MPDSQFEGQLPGPVRCLVFRDLCLMELLLTVSARRHQRLVLITLEPTVATDVTRLVRTVRRHVLIPSARRLGREDVEVRGPEPTPGPMLATD